MALIASVSMAPAAHGAERLRVVTSGAGTVTSADERIDCGDDCSATYHGTRQVALKAVPAPGFVFANWKGGCFGKSPRCVVVPAGRTRVRATFQAMQRNVRLVVSGPGTVVSEPRELSCGSAPGICGGTFRHGTTVRLIAVPDAGGALYSWAGDACQGEVATTCEFVVSGDLEVVASFRSLAPAIGSATLTVALTGGRVTSSPAGIDCPPTCDAAFPSGTPVTLTAADDMAWTSGCEGVGSTCALVVDQSTEVRATAPSPPPPPQRLFGLTVTVSGRGEVSGGDSYAGDEIRCSATEGTLLGCQHLFMPGTTVRLRAVPRKGARFERWTSFCTGKRPSCTVRLTAPKTVVAVFRRK